MNGIAENHQLKFKYVQHCQTANSVDFVLKETEVDRWT